MRRPARARLAAHASSAPFTRPSPSPGTKEGVSSEIPERAIADTVRAQRNQEGFHLVNPSWRCRGLW